MPLDNINYASGQDKMQTIFDKTNAAIDKINEITLDSGWIAVSSYTTAVSGSVSYRKIHNRVYLRGSVTIDIDNWPVSQGFFTLPVGYRPVTSLAISNNQLNNGTIPYLPIRTTINTNGVVGGGDIASSLGDSAVVNFDNISFLNN